MLSKEYTEDVRRALLLPLQLELIVRGKRERLLVLALPPAADTLCHKRTKRRTVAAAVHCTATLAT